MDDPTGTSAEREAANGVNEEVPESLAHGHAAYEVEEDSIAIDMAPVLARLREILPQIDLATTTEKMLRKRLEGELSIDLSTEKAAIRAEVRVAKLHGNKIQPINPLFVHTDPDLLGFQCWC